MKLPAICLSVLLTGWYQSISAGPEIFDPLEVYKKPNTLQQKPASETVTAGATTETARFTYEGNLLVKAEYFGAKNIPAGYTTYEYEKGLLVFERLFDAAGLIAEEIRYEYKKDKLEKSVIKDLRGNAQIEWHYSYDKEGKLAGGKRLLDRKATESFKIVHGTSGYAQHIYNTKGELTSKVEMIYENGLLRHRIKTGLTGARYAEYRYNDKNMLIEIIFHDTVRGEKTLVKKHHFDYSLQVEAPKTAFKTGN